MTTRAGGASRGPWSSLNLGAHAGDDPADVAANRAAFAASLGAAPVYLRQVHGAHVVRLTRSDLDAPPQEADASVTTEPGVACTVLVADCLPVLLAAAEAHGVAAAHAGWRGLAGGVVEAALGALCEAVSCAPSEIKAWLGGCIGARRFEVGADVLAAFAGARAERFVPSGTPGKWHADLAGLARDRLAAAGVRDISGGEWCTASDASRFFSFRRDRVCGRMAAAAWIAGGP
jgi:YfiH family protein